MMVMIIFIIKILVDALLAEAMQNYRDMAMTKILMMKNVCPMDEFRSTIKTHLAPKPAITMDFGFL